MERTGEPWKRLSETVGERSGWDFRRVRAERAPTPWTYREGAVPLPEPFVLEEHGQGMNRLVREHSTPRGIETNDHWELLVVQRG